MIEVISDIRPIETTQLKVVENPIGYLAFRIRIDYNNLVSINTPVTPIVRLANINVGEGVSNSGIFHGY